MTVPVLIRWSEVQVMKKSLIGMQVPVKTSPLFVSSPWLPYLCIQLSVGKKPQMVYEVVLVRPSPS